MRVCEIGYFRKSCLDFLNRVANTFGFRERVLGWWRSLPSYQQGFSAETFFQNVGDYGVLEGKALVSRANADKSVWLSPFVDTFLHLDEKFQLSLQEAIEVLYPICLLVEPFKYWMVLDSWITSGVLPSGCLSVAFADQCLTKFGRLATGAFPRCQPHALSPIKYSSIASSLFVLLNAVRKYNYRVRVIQHDTFSKFTELIQSGVHGAGSLTAQHLAKVLVLTGVVHHPALATKAVFAQNTKTCQRVMDATGCDKADVDKVLCLLGDALGTTTDVAENSACEATRTSERYDLYFPGQSIVIPVANNETNSWFIARHFPDGQKKVVPFFIGSLANRGASYLKRRQYFRWWEQCDTSRNIPKKREIQTHNNSSPRKVYQKINFKNSQQAEVFRREFLLGKINDAKHLAPHAASVGPHEGPKPCVEAGRNVKKVSTMAPSTPIEAEPWSRLNRESAGHSIPSYPQVMTVDEIKKCSSKDPLFSKSLCYDTLPFTVTPGLPPNARNANNAHNKGSGSTRSSMMWGSTESFVRQKKSPSQCCNEQTPPGTTRFNSF